MKYEKFDVITYEDNTKVMVLATLDYEGNTYLYVDKVNDDETNTLNKYYVLRVCEEGYTQKETNLDVLSEILPLFNKLVNEQYS